MHNKMHNFLGKHNKYSIDASYIFNKNANNSYQYFSTENIQQNGAAEACWAHNPEVDGSNHLLLSLINVNILIFLHWKLIYIFIILSPFCRYQNYIII